MPRLRAPMSNFANCLKIKEAAEFLGVSTATLRNWDRSGKLKPRRHPQNGYRIYLHEDLHALLQSADLSAVCDRQPDTSSDWSEIGDCEHIVQLYEEDDFLVKSVARFIEFALVDGGCGVVVATPEHRRQIERLLLDAGIDIAQSTAEGRFLSLDAHELLATFMVNGALDRARFHEMTIKLFGQLRSECTPIRGFGEMVAILWEQGNQSAAIELEQLWNEQGRQSRFSIMCGYPIRVFDDHDIEALDRVCSCHGRVFPAESFATSATEDQRMRSVAQLQKKARSLAAEMEHRKAIERELVRRESELSLAEQSLVDANRRKDEYLAKLSHELRDPLAPIRSAVELLDTPSADATTRSNATSVIRRQVHEMTQLVDDLLVRAEGARGGNAVASPNSSAAPSSPSRIAAERYIGEADFARSRRVLVVDDNRDSGDTLALLLRLKGHDVAVAHDGLEAIDEAARHQPEIILMDLDMPKLDGYEATRRIRQMPGGDAILIVAVTGWGQASAIARSNQAGCSAHLVKPVDFKALDQLLTNASA